MENGPQCTTIEGFLTATLNNVAGCGCDFSNCCELRSKVLQLLRVAAHCPFDVLLDTSICAKNFGCTVVEGGKF